MGLLIVLGLLFAFRDKRIPFNNQKMLEAQVDFHKLMETIAIDMSDVYGKYLADEMSEEDFLTEVEDLKDRYQHFVVFYQEVMKQVKFEAETQETDSLRAITALQNTYESVGYILDRTVKDGVPLPRADILVIYLQQMSKIEENLEIFQESLLNLYMNEVVESLNDTEK